MGKAAPYMLKELCGRFYSLLKKEAAHENEPQRILFLLRNIMLLLGLYFLIFPLVMCLVSPRTRGWIGYVFAVLAALIFFGTYRRSDVRDTAAGVGCDLYPDVWLGLRYSASDV